MNKNKILALFILSVLFFQNCSEDFLEEKRDPNRFNIDIFTSESQTISFLAGIYYNFYNGFNSPVKNLVGSSTDEYSKMTDEIGGTMSDYINSSISLYTADEGDGYYGSRLRGGSPNNEPYSRIRDCNILLESIEEYGRGEVSDNFIDLVKGQAYFLRGLQYFDLMRIYGGVPIVTEVQNGSITDESIKLPRVTIDEMLAQIGEDFDAAAELLPAQWGDGTQEGIWENGYGRPTRGAALAMKSRALLTGASPLFNKDWDNSSNQRWTDALTAGLEAEAMLTGDGYGLYGSSAKDWAEMFYSFDNSPCPEVIFTILCSSSNTGSNINNGWENRIRMSSQGGSGGLSAPKQMIDLFPMADGTRPQENADYNELLFFQNRDPRFYQTFGFSGMRWSHRNASTPVWAYTWLDEDSGVNYSFDNELQSYAFVTKMTDLNADSTAFGSSGTDIPEYRYAELLLNIAECYAAQGNISACIEYLGKIRARAGIPATNNYGLNINDKYEALEACLYERRVELAYEGKRYWDIQRWMLYNDDVSADNTTCTALGVDPLNGTYRIGKYLQVKDSLTADNPLIDVLSVSYDPNSANLEQELNDLATFYSSYFTFGELDELWEEVSGEQAVIDFKQHYYIHGMTKTVLETNTWIEQTAGWEDLYGSPGTYEYR